MGSRSPGPTRAGGGRSAKKPERPSLEIEMTEGEWRIFEDGWTRYKRMTGLEEEVEIRDELRECCGKQLNTLLVQLVDSVVLGSCSKKKLLESIKVIAVRGV